MRYTTCGVSLLSLIALAACEATDPTAPSVDPGKVEAPTISNGNGVEFTIITGAQGLAFLTDGAGNTCEIGFSDQEGGATRSDFLRTNEDGSVTTHTTDSAAPLALMVDGVEYQGVGYAVADATMNSDGDLVSVHVSAQGPVTDGGGVTYQGSCQAHGQSDSALSDASIRVH